MNFKLTVYELQFTREKVYCLPWPVAEPAFTSVIRLVSRHGVHDDWACRSNRRACHTVVPLILRCSPVRSCSPDSGHSFKARSDGFCLIRVGESASLAIAGRDPTCSDDWRSALRGVSDAAPSSLTLPLPLVPRSPYGDVCSSRPPRVGPGNGQRSRGDACTSSCSSPRLIRSRPSGVDCATSCRHGEACP